MTVNLSRRNLGIGASAVVGSLLIARTSRADEKVAVLAKPTGKVVLTVSGLISVHNVGEEAKFDMPMLEALGMTSFTTGNPWFTGPTKFEGVLMTKFLAVVGAHGKNLSVTALNDYVTKIPVSDFVEHGALMAIKRNDEYMPVSNKGPLFIVYPYDSKPELKAQKYYSRSPWQVARMDIED